MIIGIPKETKHNEYRVALTPDHVSFLCKAGHSVYVERNAGIGCHFSNEDYEKAGAMLKDSVYDCEMIVSVKEPPLSTIKRNQIIMGYLHIEKGQNPALLQKLLDKHVTSYAYEQIRDEDGERLVNLGVEAGIVGMYEGLRLYGKILQQKKIPNTFTELEPIHSFFSIKNLYNKLSSLDLRNGAKIYVLGKGKVSRGALEVLKYSKIRPIVLYRKETAHIERYLPDADIIINAVDWYPDEPRIITKKMLKIMKKTSVIVDISCDLNGSIETCIPTNWKKPTYIVDGITHFCVDNLPSAIPRDASIHLSDMIISHVLAVANGDEIATGLMTDKGVFEYSPLTVVTKKITIPRT